MLNASTSRTTAIAALLAVATAVLPLPVLCQDDPAQSLVKRADLVRFPAEGFEVDVAITTYRDDQPVDAAKYKVLSKGNESTLIMTLEPPTDRGQILLMRERDLWMFMPNVSQPIRIGMAQRLTGQVANGDLARANFSGDYRAKLLRTEKVGEENMQVLELNAVDRGVTYQRVLYWLRASNSWPYKAEFYSLSGRLLKTCIFDGYTDLGGRVRPSRLVMQDALRAGERSIMQYSQMKPRDLPDRVFTKEYLKRLQ
jgi:hypothetical protein